MVKNFEKPVGSRVDQIVREAEERLNLFYSAYGDGSNSKRTKKHKKKSAPEIKAVNKDKNDFHNFFEKKTTPKKINRPPQLIVDPPPIKPAPLLEYEEPVVVPVDEEVLDAPLLEEDHPERLLENFQEEPLLQVDEPLSTNFAFVLKSDASRAMARELNEISLAGLTSPQIIVRVKELTGRAITVCVKSKINVIRHAKIILKESGFTVRE